ncbi:hypothetical protein EAH89_14370 [Roseomonas nepalensis]|uniref:Uncharacterized protein n=1 Tax=Muricoccus nepalensis TaxID=1854500 RepID=A0A502G2G0_9PROT|nr:hypothetical protein [Roseomonas nepalensis]TPG55740.1 hypothetical protein EAH89_14370 [Roseomonas nepalensis]
MLKAVRDVAPEGAENPDAAGRETRPRWGEFPRLVEEDRGSPAPAAPKRPPETGELRDLTDIAISLGNPRAR